MQSMFLQQMFLNFMEGSLKGIFWYFKVGWELVEIRHLTDEDRKMNKSLKDVRSVEIWRNEKTGEMRNIFFKI